MIFQFVMTTVPAMFFDPPAAALVAGDATDTRRGEASGVSGGAGALRDSAGGGGLRGWEKSDFSLGLMVNKYTLNYL